MTFDINAKYVKDLAETAACGIKPNGGHARVMPLVIYCLARFVDEAGASSYEIAKILSENGWYFSADDLLSSLTDLVTQGVVTMRKPLSGLRVEKYRLVPEFHVLVNKRIQARDDQEHGPDIGVLSESAVSIELPKETQKEVPLLEMKIKVKGNEVLLKDLHFFYTNINWLLETQPDLEHIWIGSSKLSREEATTLKAYLVAYNPFN